MPLPYLDNDWEVTWSCNYNLLPTSPILSHGVDSSTLPQYSSLSVWAVVSILLLLASVQSFDWVSTVNENSMVVMQQKIKKACTPGLQLCVTHTSYISMATSKSSLILSSCLSSYSECTLSFHSHTLRPQKATSNLLHIILRHNQLTIHLFDVGVPVTCTHLGSIAITLSEN